MTAYGGVAAIAFALTTPPFAEVFGLPRWTVFAFFTASGMALTATLVQTPLFLVITYIVRRSRAADPVLVLVVGVATGALAGLIFTYLDGNLGDNRLGDLEAVIHTTIPVGFMLAVFVLFASWLRRKGARRRERFPR